MNKDAKPETNLALYQEKTVRRQWYEGRGFYSVINAIAILTDSDLPRKYWSDLKTKRISEGYVEVFEKIIQLKMRVTDAADTITLAPYYSKYS